MSDKLWKCVTDYNSKDARIVWLQYEILWSKYAFVSVQYIHYEKKVQENEYLREFVKKEGR